MEASRLRETAIAVVRRLREAGHDAYFAGGCVRDRLLGIAPTDYDVATSARPEEVEGLFARTVAVGKAFGVIRVIESGAEIEVATFRSEGPYPDGRRPDPGSIRFTSAQEDVLRRDFTVNGLLEDPLEDRILDFVGGREDLEKKIIRTIGDPEVRFAEDRLRLLRAVRFACQLGFQIEPATEQAVRRMAAGIRLVSWERIRDELAKILTSSRRGWGLRALRDLGLLAPILPEVAGLAGVPQPKEWHPEGDVWVHTVMTVEQIEPPRLELVLGALLHDVGKPRTLQMDGDRPRFNRHEHVGADMAQEICARLRLSNEQTRRIVYLVRSHMKFKDVKRMRLSTLRRFLSEEGFEDLKLLHRADVLASNRDLSALEYVEAKQREFAREGVRPAPLLRGRDLVAMGIEPGPVYSEILAAVEERQLEGELTTPEEARSFVRGRWGHLFPG